MLITMIGTAELMNLRANLAAARSQLAETADRLAATERESERDFEHCDIDRIWAHQALDEADRLIDWIEQNVAGADGELSGRIFAAIRKYGDFVAEHEKRLAADMAAWETRWHEEEPGP